MPDLQQPTEEILSLCDACCKDLNEVLDRMRTGGETPFPPQKGLLNVRFPAFLALGGKLTRILQKHFEEMLDIDFPLWYYNSFSRAGSSAG